MLNTISVIVITIILTYFTLVFGELVPKQLAIQKPEAISNIAVGPISIMAKICLPIVKFLTFSINIVLRLFRVDPNAQNEDATEEDIRMMVDIGGERGTINHSEREMIDNVFEFNDKTASDIITHRTDIAAFPVEMDFNEILDQIDNYRYTRFPVYEGDMDNIVGVLHVKDLFPFVKHENMETVNLKHVMRKPYFVMESQTIDVLFSHMRNENIHIAIVLDEFGGTEGIITIEDVIEEIVGDISSESREQGFSEEEIEQLSPTQYLVEGTCRLWELEDIFSVEFPTEEFDTINGFLINEIGYIPSKEDKPVVTYSNLTFNVKEIEDNRIQNVIVTVENKQDK